MRITRRRLAGMVAIAMVVAALVARIAWVNVTYPHVRLETYEMGEWVPLDGDFMSYAGEGTAHYAVRVDGAQVMTVDDYRRAYDDGSEALGVNGNARCLVVLTLSIRNDGDDQGGFGLPLTFLVGAAGDETYIYSGASQYAIEPLRAYDGPETDDSWARGLGIDPHSQCQVHVAYLLNEGSEAVGKDAADTSFTLHLSQQPVRKMVRVRLAGES